jgi:hypothetical protein
LLRFCGSTDEIRANGSRSVAYTWHPRWRLRQRAARATSSKYHRPSNPLQA